jgi:hypothetical protein
LASLTIALHSNWRDAIFLSGEVLRFFAKRGVKLILSVSLLPTALNFFADEIDSRARGRVLTEPVVRSHQLLKLLSPDPALGALRLPKLVYVLGLKVCRHRHGYSVPTYKP